MDIWWKADRTTTAEEGQRCSSSALIDGTSSLAQRRVASGRPIILPSSVGIGACVLAPVLPRVTFAALFGTSGLANNKKKEVLEPQKVSRAPRDGDDFAAMDGGEDAAYRPAVVRQLDNVSGVAVVTFVDEMQWEGQAADEHSVPISSLGELTAAAAQSIRSNLAVRHNPWKVMASTSSHYGSRIVPEEFRTATITGANGFRCISIPIKHNLVMARTSSGWRRPSAVAAMVVVPPASVIFFLLTRIMFVTSDDYCNTSLSPPTKEEAAPTTMRRRNGGVGGGGGRAKRQRRMILFDDEQVLQTAAELLCLIAHHARSQDVVFRLRTPQPSSSPFKTEETLEDNIVETGGSANSAGVDWLLGMWPAVQLHDRAVPIANNSDDGGGKHRRRGCCTLTFDAVVRGHDGGRGDVRTVNSDGGWPQKCDSICWWMVVAHVGKDEMAAAAGGNSTTAEGHAAAVAPQLAFAATYCANLGAPGGGGGSNGVRPKTSSNTAAACAPPPPRLVQYHLHWEGQNGSITRSSNERSFDMSPAAEVTMGTALQSSAQKLSTPAKRISLQDIAGGSSHCNGGSSSTKRFTTPGRSPCDVMMSCPSASQRMLLQGVNGASTRLQRYRPPVDAIDDIEVLHVALPASTEVLRVARSLLSSPSHSRSGGGGGSDDADDGPFLVSDSHTCGGASEGSSTPSQFGKRPRRSWGSAGHRPFGIWRTRDVDRPSSLTAYETFKKNWMSLAEDALVGWSDAKLMQPPALGADPPNVAALPRLLDALHADIRSGFNHKARADEDARGSSSNEAGMTGRRRLGGSVGRVLVLRTTSWEQCTSMSPACIASREAEALRVDVLLNDVEEGLCYAPLVPLRACLAKSLVVADHRTDGNDGQACSDASSSSSLLLLPEWCIDGQQISKWIRCGGTLVLTVPERAPSASAMSGEVGGGGGCDAVEDTICSGLDARALLAVTNADAVVFLGRRGLQWAEAKLSGASSICGVPILPPILLGVCSELEVHYPALELDRETAQRFLERNVQWSIPIAACCGDKGPTASNGSRSSALKRESELHHHTGYLDVAADLLFPNRSNPCDEAEEHAVLPQGTSSPVLSHVERLLQGLREEHRFGTLNSLFP